MFQTEVTKILGIKYPIIGGTMMHLSTADFVAAISNAGGLGILASAIFRTREDFAAAIDRVHELTDQPYAVNLNFFPAMRPIDNTDYLDIMIEKGVKIVETSGHAAPAELCGRFKAEGMVWIHKCVGPRYALKVQDMGADIVTVVGYENGGATGKLDIGTLVLVPTVVEALRIPVIGGGGVADGRGLLAILSLGAGAAIVGTRLLLTKECPAHDNVKNALLTAKETDTRLVMRSIGATHRVWINNAATKCDEVEAACGGLEDIIAVASGEKAKLMYQNGDVNGGILPCGQSVGLAHDVPSVAELFERMMAEAEEQYRKLGS
jgi:nitronate monooxygenase